MASLRKEIDRGRIGWRLQLRVNGHRRSLWIGEASKRVASGVARHVEELALAKESGHQADAGHIQWANSLEGRMRDTLTKWGLIEPANPKRSSDAGRLLGPCLDAYLASRTDCKPRTISNYKQARRLLCEYFGERHSIRSITPADADRWRRWLLARVVKKATETTPAETMAIATVSKHIKRTKTMFTDAVRDRLLSANPFADQKGGNEANKARHHFVDRTASAAVLKACPDHDWRLIFALPRYGGLRCPTEVTGLTWADIDWAENRIRIDSVKTGLRFCPIFPELRPILDAAFHAAPPGSTHCVQRYRGAVNLGTQMKRIIENAGQVPWPKTFVNLRSTRRTELQEAFPSHVVDEWLGHSTKTAETHYLQVTADHWAAGAIKPTGQPADSGGVTGGVIVARQDDSGHVADTKKDRDLRPFDGSWPPMKSDSVPPQGLEPWTNGLRVRCSTN